MILNSLRRPVFLKSAPAALEARNYGIWSTIKSVMGSERTKLAVTGSHLYENIADSINFPKFFMKYQMPNTFNSWFLITELHTWMVLVRIMEDEDKGRIIRNSVVESLWLDAGTRARQLGAENPSAVRNQLAELSGQFQTALIIYDDGLQSNDKVLASAIWERLMEKRCNDYRNLEEMVKYVRKGIHTYENISFEEILKNPKIMAEKFIQETADGGKTGK